MTRITFALSLLALTLALAGCALDTTATPVPASATPAATTPALPPGKLAPKPLFRDPVYGQSTDPVIIYNAETKRWLMYYTQRRGGGIALIHGCKIGMAASEDNGATWKYLGTADITYGQKEHPDDFTYWAPEVIWVNGLYHMFLTFVPGIFNDWNHPREIGHLTSKDGLKWDTVGKIDLKSDRTIDACVIQLPNTPDGKPGGGGWRMFYKDEASTTGHIVSYADSPDLYTWEAKGNAVTDRNGEGEKCFHWQGKYWLLADTDRPENQAVWVSDDATHWTPQDSYILGNHGDVVINPVTQRAYWFYFGTQRPGNINWAVTPGYPMPTSAPAPASASSPGITIPGSTPATSTTTAPAPGRGRGGPGGGLSINVVELKVINGKLMYTNPSDAVYIDLGNQRELEK